MLLLPEDCIQLLCSLSLSFDCAVSQANLTTDVVGTFTKRFKAEAAAKKAAIADKVSAQRELAAIRAAMQTLECDRNSAIASAKVRCHDVRSCPLSLCKQAGGAAQNLGISSAICPSQVPLKAQAGHLWGIPTMQSQRMDQTGLAVCKAVLLRILCLPDAWLCVFSSSGPDSNSCFLWMCVWHNVIA